MAHFLSRLVLVSILKLLFTIASILPFTQCKIHNTGLAPKWLFLIKARPLMQFATFSSLARCSQHACASSLGSFQDQGFGGMIGLPWQLW